ncbi:MAG: M48 family metallopeptidase [Acidobacteriota bacterium]|jgi:predicted Zn-dependent protease
MMRLSFLLLLPALAACSVLNAPGGGVNLISVQDEWKMGMRLAAEVDAEMEILSQPEADRYLTSLGQRLLRASDSELARLPWTFHLIKDPAVNAFNIPGGHVYINTGLVDAMSTEAELASVIGHEIGHGLNRHGTKQLTKQVGVSVLLSLALGDNPSAVEQIAAAVTAQGTLMKFSRDDELQADLAGISLMSGAGWDPQGTVDMLEVLASLSESEPSMMEKFLSSHPQPGTRIADAQQRIDSMPENPNAIVTTDNFRRYKAYVARFD